MEVVCPKCGCAIDSEDVNVGADTAFCRRCSEAFKLSELVHPEVPVDFELDNPPPGAWFDQVDKDEFIVGARTRSKMGCFLIPFTIAWSGGSLGGIYGSQIITGKFELTLCLFGIPFLLGSIFLWIMSLMTIWGITVLKVERGYARLFTGIGRIGRTKQFDWYNVTGIRVEKWSSGNDESPRTKLVIEADRRIQFGTMLNDERRRFMLNALRKLLAERDMKK